MDNPDDPEDIAPRDPTWLRFAKFLSIIVVLAVFFGALFAFSIHVASFVDAIMSRRHYVHAAIARDASQDTGHAFRVRFIVGACIGGSLGLFYMIRCLIKRVDP